MSQVIIDGYNLLLREKDSNASLADAREAFLRQVDAVRHGKQQVIVVFDGRPGPRARSQSDGLLRVVFAASPKSADDLIVSFVSKAGRGQSTVLTNDRELRHRVRSVGGKLGDARQFFAKPKRNTSGSAKSEKPSAPKGLELDAWEELFERRSQDED